MRATTDAWRVPHARGAYLGLLASLLCHAAAYAVLSWAGTMPSVDFQLTLPSNVEFGITEPIVAPAPAAPPVVPPLATAAAATPAPGPTPDKPKPKVHRPEPADAGSPDEHPPAISHRDRQSAGSDPTKPALSAFAPAGAQIALRLQMIRIRDSELADDVRALLDAVPDWRLIVAGSGLDPLHDLERLYLASPDLQRASVVIAGQYAGDEDVPRRAVENLAAARGTTVNFRNYGAIPVAPWANADTTERVVALIAPHQFAITRPDDLPRVLQVARALARRKQKAGSAVSDPGDALLALEPNQLLVVSVEGARAFARGNLAGIPERLEISVQTSSEPGFEVHITGTYEGGEPAQSAAKYWAHTRDRFASHPLLALVGMRDPLADAKIESHENTLEASTRVSIQQARVLLGFVRSAFPSAGEESAPAPSPPSPSGRSPSPIGQSQERVSSPSP